MTSKVFVRFINEKQWVKLCSRYSTEEQPSVPDDIYVEWASAELDGRVADSQIVPFNEFVEQLRNRWSHSYQYGITLIISGANVFTAEVNIPSKQTRHIAQALPFMIEDQVAQDVSLFHLITGERSSDGDLPVVGVPVQLVEGTRALFADFDLPLDSILPDMLCLPLRDNEWSLLFDGKHLLIKRSEMDGLAIEMDAAPVVLNSVMEHWQDRPAVLRVLFCLEHLNENLQNWIRTQISGQVADAELEVEYDEANASDFQLLCDHIHGHFGSKKPRFDFLQGRFASSGRRKPSHFNWKPLAAMVALFVVSYSAFLHTQAWKMNQEAEALEQETRQLYKQLFPRDKRIVNVKRQMQQHIDDFQSGASGQSFLALLAQAGEQIYDTNRATSNAIAPQRVAYDDGQGDLRMDLMVKDFGQLEAFKTKLQKAELGVETASATQDKEGVKARLKIRSERS
ncbi:type II secretion system protein GspL [Ketobacter sp.]|uniref:type II secretion system protein GspL n=1 Tax=Ketobacter sp. TaxID=2083498 RepID=UPI000F11C813|nr:type II secretion system protein GspL [Ketobacter sp.]RLT97429.1 MAG: hypothetical protein D9N14_11660 [Ketobacter sp.]